MQSVFQTLRTVSVIKISILSIHLNLLKACYVRLVLLKNLFYQFILTCLKHACSGTFILPAKHHL